MPKKLAKPLKLEYVTLDKNNDVKSIQYFDILKNHVTIEESQVVRGEGFFGLAMRVKSSLDDSRDSDMTIITRGDSLDIEINFEEKEASPRVVKNS